MVTKDVNRYPMIIATARIHELAIVTADEIFKAHEVLYAEPLLKSGKEKGSAQHCGLPCVSFMKNVAAMAPRMQKGRMSSAESYV